MIIRNYIMVLLAMFLILGCVGAVSANDISSVTITVTKPTTGGTPATSVSDITSGTSGSLSWSPGDTPFAPGTSYTATVTVTAAEEYNFTTSVGVTINGDFSVTPTSLTNKSFTVSYTFVATDTITLDTVNLTLTAPVTENTPGTPLSDTKGVEMPSVLWSPNNSPFNANETYTATITVPASAGYLFDSSPTVKVNTDKVIDGNVSVADDKKSLTAIYCFTETTPIEISSPIILTLTQPATGNTATSPSSTTTGVGTPRVVWSPTVSSTFVEGQAYYANITIPVASTNYKFASSPAVTLNGGDVSSEIVSRTDTQLILNHSFDATALKTRIDSVTITGVTAPVYGATPVTSVTPPTGISSVTVSWNSTTPATFAANTTYTATIIAKTSSGYVFSTSTPSVSLNGATASTTNVTRNSDTQITITYTFPKTASATLPTAVLSMNPASGTVPLTVIFSYTLSNFDNCTLTYGDGNLSTLNASGSCTHTYSSIKSYTATLTAKNVNGTTTDTKTITVKKVGLVAGFQTNPTTLSGTVPFTVKFTDSSLGTITKRTWNFGDGTVDSSTVNPTHTYNTAGSYKVTLTIGDGTDTDFTTKTIHVTSPVTATPSSTSSVSSVGAITLEDLIIPGPFDIIKEFLNLFYSLLNSDNYLFLNNTTNTTT